MKHVVAAVVVVALLTPAGVAIVEACGAKFLVAARSARLQKMQRAAKPANILLYQHSDDPKQDAADLEDLTTGMSVLLDKVGHSVTVAASEDALRETIRSADFDVVIVQLGAARRLRPDLNSWAPGTTVLPMERYLTKAQAAQAKEEFGQLLKLPATPTEVLSTVRDSARRN